MDLFNTIRYSFMKHEDLLALTANPAFSLAKDFIIEGLSVRLDPKKTEGLKINVKPRDKKQLTAAEKKAEEEKKKKAEEAKGGPAKVTSTGMGNSYKEGLN